MNSSANALHLHIVLYPVHYIADSNVWYFSEFGTWLEIWTTKIKMSIPNKEKGFNCGRKWSKSGLKLTQLKTGQTICLPCRHNEGKHCTHGAHCVETLFWYVWSLPYLIFVASISSGASVKSFDWGEFFHNERERDSCVMLYSAVCFFYTQCVILHRVCNFTHSE